MFCEPARFDRAAKIADVVIRSASHSAREFPIYIILHVREGAC